MRPMTVKVFNTSGNVLVTDSGGFIGAYESADVEPGDSAVATALADGSLVVEAAAPAEAPAEAATDPEPEAAPRPRSRNKTTEPEA